MKGSSLFLDMVEYDFILYDLIWIKDFEDCV